MLLYSSKGIEIFSTNETVKFIPRHVSREGACSAGVTV